MISEKMPKDHRISVGISNAEHSELQVLSQKHRVSIAWLGRQAITEFLQNYRGKEVPLPLAFDRDIPPQNNGS